MYHTLIVEVLQTLENLCHVDADKVFRELAVCLADRVQRAIFAVSAQQSALVILGISSPFNAVGVNELEDDVQAVLRLDEANVLDNVVVMEILEEIDLGLSREILSTTQALSFQHMPPPHFLYMLLDIGEHSHLDTAQLALGHIGKLDLLDGNGLAGAPIERLINRAERSLPNTIAKSLCILPERVQVSKRTKSKLEMPFAAQHVRSSLCAPPGIGDPNPERRKKGGGVDFPAAVVYIRNPSARDPAAPSPSHGHHSRRRWQSGRCRVLCAGCARRASSRRRRGRRARHWSCPGAWRPCSA